MNEFILQCKGIDADKVNIPDYEMFYSSKKYDGIYIQIQKSRDDVSFYTSSGKEFSCIFAVEFSKYDFDFKIETEYICDGGKLGTRSKADNEIKKAVKDSNFQLTGEFKIHDVLRFDHLFCERLSILKKFDNVVEFDLISYSQTKQNLNIVSSDGWEGLFLKKATHIHRPGKRSNDAIKLKPKYTVDLPVFDIVKNWLWCKDDQNRIAKVQVGFDVAANTNIGDIIEVQYEQIQKTYVQAVYVTHRYDKIP